MKKDLAVIFGLFLVIVILLIFGRAYTSPGLIGVGGVGGRISQSSKQSILVRAKTLEVQAKVANTEARRKSGLSKLESLPLTEGMLFVFEKEGRYGFWMKDMKFAIDIIWMDKDKKIAEIAQNVPPEPGKKDKELTIYKPASSALYVLEVNAGLSSLNSLQVGDSVNFEL